MTFFSVTAAGSGWLPILPETVSVHAGLVAMPFARFTVALACGAIPFGFTFTAVGHYGADRPILTFGLAPSRCVSSSNRVSYGAKR